MQQFYFIYIKTLKLENVKLYHILNITGGKKEIFCKGCPFISHSFVSTLASINKFITTMKMNFVNIYLKQKKSLNLKTTLLKTI